MSLAFGQGALAQDKRAIRIATEGAFPPFNYVEGNEPRGLEIELGQAFCQAAGLSCTFVTHEWESIIKGLIDKQYDAVMSSLVINDRRRMRIAFTRRYYRMPASFMAQKESGIGDASAATLAGKTIGTERADFEAYLARTHKGVTMRLYGKLEEANLDLLTGRLDFVFGDKLALTRFLEGREGHCCRLVGDAPADAPILGEGIGIGLRKDDKDLKEIFNRAIEQVMADGTYDRIRAKYIPFDIK